MVSSDIEILFATEENKMTLYIAHVCLNSKLKPLQKGTKENKGIRIEHPDFCERGFVDIAPDGASGEQCWKYCSQCEAKGFPKINKKTVNKNISEQTKRMNNNKCKISAGLNGRNGI